jgi:restriction endonuclease S subunit
LPADNIDLSGNLVLNKLIYLKDETQIGEEKKLRQNDIFICMSSGSKEHIGKVAFVTNNTDFYAGGFMGIIRTNPYICLSKWLYYYLRFSPIYRSEIKTLTQGGNINNISGTINTLKIPIPPLEVQQRIIDEFDGYQCIIDGARAVVENCKPVIPLNIDGKLLRLEDIAVFRPSKEEVKTLADDTLVSFVPMSTLNTHIISFKVNEDRKIKEVYTGFSYFRDNDILLAKITPCFENGKAGIARNLRNGVGFGSTEYIVIRAKPETVYPEWIYYHINSKEFIKQGKEAMVGTAGQQRIDINFVKNYSIMVPPIALQRQILDGIETEQILVSSSKQLIDVFTKKMQARINEIWGE